MADERVRSQRTMLRRLLPWFGILLAIVLAVVVLPLLVSHLLVNGPSR